MILKRKKKESKLEYAISTVHGEMEAYDADSPEFARMVEQLDKLYKMQSYRKDTRVSADTAATIAANLAGILLIMNHERVHVIATKAFGLVSKTKI